MPTPKVYAYPVERPNFLSGVQWIGQQGDAQLNLQLEYTDDQGLPAQTNLYTLPYEEATLCLPNTALITDISEDVLLAHLRMAGMISGTVPGSQEYFDALTINGQGNARNFQTAVGEVKVNSISTLTDELMRVTLQKGSATPRVIDIAIDDLATYTFTPSTQLQIVTGSIKKQFPTYVQDANNNDFLTQPQMDAILACVLTLKLWI